ncbi:MAG: aminodeoxychorismate synthase component I [Paracoccaceae bacterium]|nr:aminodeoxychorismate synthase component I [Paracoccaceae bacterium]
MIIYENGPNGQAAYFDRPQNLIIAHHPDEVGPALAQLDRARALGFFVAGYLSYEAGLALEPALVPLIPQTREAPLLAFGVYEAPRAADQVFSKAQVLSKAVQLSAFTPLISRAAYETAFNKVAAYIAAGDCYQINLTFPLIAQLTKGTGLGLYGALRARQTVGHGSYINFGDQIEVISRSPELFFSLDAEGQISARPMKGTAPRHPDPVEDRAIASALAASGKDRAENLMIVDLLRNDIARIAKTGTVKVPELYAIETYATVHQMSSRVIGQLAKPAALTDVMAALFPCGSITGAPKIRAMQIIAEVEPTPRGLYCGAMGWMGPDGCANFNVGIRTLRLFKDKSVHLNVGGGIVYDSTASGEYEEALWKARFAYLT